jgi:DNA topoisomerase I
MKNLLILESPNKVKKVQGYVGSDYLVSASKGHITTLGTKKILGIDIDNNYKPTYNVDPYKKNVVTMLNQLKKKCDDVLYIATDFDREGEAIGWHVMNVLGFNNNNIKRLVFKEITKKGLQDALKSPVKIDMNMVDSQQARMILDKLIGYKVSPVLWNQFSNYKLSSGRVQSVVVKLINERNNIIEKFKSNNYYKLTSQFSLSNNPRNSDIDTECEYKFQNINTVSRLIHHTHDGKILFYINELTKNKTKRRPSPPFTTSSLQQEASNKLGMSPDECMKTAQKLYEAGLITYMRTDSFMLSNDALDSLEKVIKSKYGEKYYKRTIYNKKKSKGAQEAHEACRPTDLKTENVIGIQGLSSRANRLYHLIWCRTMACQMTPAEVEISTIKVKSQSNNAKSNNNNTKSNKTNSKTSSKSIKTSGKTSSKNIESSDELNEELNDEYIFMGKFEKILFNGFLVVYNFKNMDSDEEGEESEESTKTGTELTTNEDDKKSGSNASKSNKAKTKDILKMEKLFDSLIKGQEVWCNIMEALEKQTKCPNSRYTEASLIKHLEELGIGRPSTYASMVTKVQERDYVEKKTILPKEKEFNRIVYNYSKKNVDTDKILQNVDGEKNKLFSTNIGVMITDFLNKEFDRFMDYGFTALVEAELDEIANGTKKWYLVVDSVWLYLNPIIDRLNKLIKKTKKETGMSNNNKLIGTNPETDNDIYLMTTKYGWSLMEEVSTTEKKLNKWASLPVDINHDELTLDTALKMFIYPRKVGTYKGKDLLLCKSKNIYLKYDDKNYNLEQYCKLIEESNNNLPKDKKGGGKTSNNITLPNIEDFSKDDCINAINKLNEHNKNVNDKKNEKITFKETNDFAILNGMYGYYIKYLEQFNIPLPYKWKKDCKGITYKDCIDCISKFVNKKGLKVKLKEQLNSLNII